MSGEEDKEAVVTRHCNVEDSAEEGQKCGVFAFEETLISSASLAKYNSHRVSPALRQIHTWVVNPFSYLYLWHNWLTLWLQYEFTEKTCIKHLNKELIWICHNIWFMFPGSRLRHGGSSLLCPHYLASINTFMRPFALSQKENRSRPQSVFIQSRKGGRK